MCVTSPYTPIQNFYIKIDKKGNKIINFCLRAFRCFNVSNGLPIAMVFRAEKFILVCIIRHSERVCRLCQLFRKLSDFLLWKFCFKNFYGFSYFVKKSYKNVFKFIVFPLIKIMKIILDNFQKYFRSFLKSST